MSYLVVGSGGFAREVLQYVRDRGHACRGFLADRPQALAAFDLGVPVLGTIESFHPEPGDQALVAVGDPAVRRALARRLEARGVVAGSLVHPLAYVARNARVAPGAVICPFAFVAPHAVVEAHAVLNTYASVGHDSVLGALAVLSPYAVVNGSARIGEGVFMGTAAAVQPGLAVGRWAKIAAGAVVTRDVPDLALAAGNPATARVLFREPA